MLKLLNIQNLSFLTFQALDKLILIMLAQILLLPQLP